MRKLILVYTFILLCGYSIAQEGGNAGIELNYSQGKDRLLKQSLKVLTEYYNVNLAEAELQQAKLWNNPYFVWNADMYSIEQNKYFNFSNQKLIQLEYVFAVSGKRVNAIRQANIGIELSKLAYSDVVRGLILEYSVAFSNLYTLIEKRKIFEMVLEKYKNLLASSEKQLELGVISPNDLIRLKSEFISIQTEAMVNQNEILNEQSNLNTILNMPAETIIKPIERTAKTKDSLNATLVIDAAKTFRPDLQIAQKNISFYQQELKRQRSESVPDIKLAYQPHDKGSNYVRPYSGMVFEMSLPIFNRNQGEISKANIHIEQSKNELEMVKIMVENEVISAYLQYVNNRNNLSNYSDDFMKQVEELSVNAIENFKRKNISLLQFIDFQRTFIDTQLQYLDMKNIYLQSVNAMNFCVGKEITN